VGLAAGPDAGDAQDAELGDVLGRLGFAA
jgi:hypothetical protein